MGRENTYVYNDTFKVHIGEHKNVLTSFSKPKEPYVVVNNKDLTLKILNSPCKASRNGWYNSWDCMITTTENLVFVASIESSILCSLMANTVIKNGVVQDKVIYASVNGYPAFLNDKMPEYKECMAVMKKKKGFEKSKKTSKWEKGKVYETATRKSVYLADVNCWLHEDENGKFTLLKEPVKKKLVFDICVETSAKSLLEKRYPSFRLMDKLPARRLSDMDFDGSVTDSDLEAWNHRMVEEWCKGYGTFSLRLSTFSFSDKLSDKQLKEIEILKSLPRNGYERLLR